MRGVLLFLVLCGFYLLLSQQSSSFLLVAGALCCAFTTWISSRLEIIGDEGQPTRGLLPFLFYTPWLIKQVILANLDVIKRVWKPSKSIDPRLFELPIQVRHPVAKTLLANSITLTPGTVTVEVNEDHLLVHALTEEAETSLRKGDMEQRVLKMEEVSV